MDKEIKKQFDKKRRILSNAKTQLKKHFVGIDFIIDDVIEKITAWYLFPEMATRPLIINLWGMTGVGKTDMIRRLVSLLKMNDSFLEIQMSTKNNNKYDVNTLYGKMVESNLEPENQAIVLLDEFQRYRTINDHGEEILDNDFQDVWMLLSDGRFSSDANAKNRLIEMYCEYLYNEERGQDDEDDFFSSNVNKKKKTFCIWPHKAKELKTLLGLRCKIEEVMQMDKQVLMDMVSKAINDIEYTKQPDFTKLLIFVSGNLDEVFRSAVKVSNADDDADGIYLKTKNINMISIKDGLAERFKPEQISRLGNIHMIYPSLNKACYVEIIKRRLKEVEAQVKSKCNGIDVCFSNSVTTFIYDNGVFPTQGTRPVFSTIDDFYNTILPEPLLYCLENDAKQLAVIYDKQHNMFVCEVYKSNTKIKTITKKYTGTLDSIRLKNVKDVNHMALTSVHEAGHSVVYHHLFGYAPDEIVLNLTNLVEKGTTKSIGFFDSRNNTLNDIMVCFGGNEAEKLVFGEGNQSSGHSSDMYRATSLASALYRVLGAGANASQVTPITSDQASDYNTDIETSNAEIEKLLSDCKSEVKHILQDKIAFLVDVSCQLMDNKKILPKEFKEIAERHGLQCKTKEADKSIPSNYNVMLQLAKANYLKKTKKTSRGSVSVKPSTVKGSRKR